MEINELLKMSVQKNASDLHISPGQPPILRISGDLFRLDQYPILDPQTTKQFILNLLDERQKNALETEWELDFAVELPDVSRFRVNAFYQSTGIAAVFRAIPKTIPTLDQLSMPKIFKQLLELPNGLILVTGPTGSGKSTTLASMVNHINMTQTNHIITIEDPIEFTHQSQKSLINQRQVNRDTHHFSNALRSALREDPDVILVGEMRDLETIRLALTAAETGHLVMATLHTSSAPRAISRIVDVFRKGEKNIIRNMLSESLQAVISQTLVKTLTGERMAAFEIMIGTNAIRNLIREGKIAQMYSSMQTGSQYGMCTLEQYLQTLVSKQIISPAMALEHTINKKLFTQDESSKLFNQQDEPPKT